MINLKSPREQNKNVSEATSGNPVSVQETECPSLADFCKSRGQRAGRTRGPPCGRAAQRPPPRAGARPTGECRKASDLRAQVRLRPVCSREGHHAHHAREVPAQTDAASTPSPPSPARETARGGRFPFWVFGRLFQHSRCGVTWSACHPSLC